MKPTVSIPGAIGAALLLIAASRAPLVLNGAQQQQLQSSDTLKLPNVSGSMQCIHADSSGNLTGTSADCAAGANPSATAGDAAVNGTAATFMRSDATPAVQQGSASQKGIVQCDGTTITCTAGVISATGGTGTLGTTWWFSPPKNGTNSGSLASIGIIITPQANMTVFSATAFLTTVTGATYRIGIASFNDTTHQMMSAPTYSTVTSYGGTGSTDQSVVGNFAGGFSMIAGTTYVIFLNRTGAGDTPAITIDNFIGNPDIYPNLVVNGTAPIGRFVAKASPATSDTWAVGGGSYLIWIAYSTP